VLGIKRDSGNSELKEVFIDDYRLFVLCLSNPLLILHLADQN